MSEIPHVDGDWEAQRRTGRFAIAPYTTEETAAWLDQSGAKDGNLASDSTVEAKSSTIQSIAELTYEDLVQLRIRAFDLGDYELIQAVSAEAHKRDGFDDTDPRFAHLIEDCRDNIKDIMVDFG
jgi:hypothetical protein